MKSLSLLISAIALLALNACSTPTAAEKQHDQYQEMSTSLKEEKEVGRQMAAKLAGAFGLFTNSSLSKYVSLVGLTVASQSNRPEITYHFAVLISDEVNAMATPGGYIFVTTGLLKSLRNESELAGILGHEIAHVTEKHMYNVIVPKRQVSAAETLTRLLSRGGTDIGFSLGKIVNAGIDLLLEQGLGPEKESDADAVGISLAMSAGYRADSLLAYLQYLAEQKSTVKVSKTHPPFPERIARLRAYMVKNGIPEISGDNPEPKSDTSLAPNKNTNSITNPASNSVANATSDLGANSLGRLRDRFDRAMLPLHVTTESQSRNPGSVKIKK